MERSTLESQGILSSAILAFVEEAEERLDALHSVMVARNGQVVAIYPGLESLAVLVK